MLIQHQSCILRRRWKPNSLVSHIGQSSPAQIVGRGFSSKVVMSTSGNEFSIWIQLLDTNEPENVAA